MCGIFVGVCVWGQGTELLQADLQIVRSVLGSGELMLQYDQTVVGCAPKYHVLDVDQALSMLDGYNAWMHTLPEHTTFCQKSPILVC